MSVALAPRHPGASGDPGRPLQPVRTGLDRARAAVADGVALLLVIVAIPFAMLLIGLPFVLILQLLLRLAGLH